MALFISVTLLLGVCVGLSAETRRDLSEIRYQFTSCGVTGRTGPSIRTCKDHYAASDSPIFRDDVLFEFENGEYQGAQGFRVPKDGVYNITVVGASGGRGICNVQGGGRGYSRTVQVKLVTDFELLVMVGQRGIAPCSVIPTSDPVYTEICSIPPVGALPETADVCNETWFNITRAFDRMFYDMFGGAGGGGASLVRARNRTSGVFDNFPIVMAGGGAGSAAILDYDIVAEIGAQTPFLSNAIAYKTFLNAQGRNFDGDHGIAGVRGFRFNSANNIAGAGGGYSLGIARLIEVDGRPSRTPQDFANGGFDCVQAVLALGDFPYHGAFGGFGGGGGACGGGGGGGGYSGGAILEAGNTVPGGGGFSYTAPTGDDFFSSFNISVVGDMLSTGNRSDGYVNIVEANCGCVHVCIVYENDDQFECKCPNDTALAPDLRDCFEEFLPSPLNVLEIDSPTTLDTNMILINRTIYMFGVDAVLSTASTSSDAQDNQCVLLFLGTNSEVVAVSNIVSLPGTANMVALIENISSSVYTTSTYSSLLNSSVLVTGALLVGTDDCNLATMQITLFASIQDPLSTAEPIQSELPSSVLSAALDIANSLFFPMQTTVTTDVGPTSVRSQVLSSGEIAGIVIAGVVFFVLAGLVLFMLVVVVWFVAQKQQTIQLDRRVLAVPDDATPRYLMNDFRHKDSLIPNAAYNLFDPTEQPVSPTKDNAQQNGDFGYEQLDFEDEGERPTSQVFQPRYGINAPDFDFTQFNRKRSNSILSTTDWHYPRSSLTYMRELGEGQFGKVLLMKAKNIAGFDGNIPVAVKTLTSRDPEIIDKFREEAELMKKFSHPNIVSLLGYIPQEIGEDSAPLMILEYMPFGDLLDFLNSHSPTSGRSDVIAERYFYKFGADIARGLEFLSGNNFVHRDVAARNCLVGANLRIKIADFGLARGLQNKDYYKVGGSAVLPVRWMAPECLLYGVFTSASDVWSYGVLLWEIVTYGRPPLETVDIQTVIDAAQDGTLHHARPENCPDDLYSIISQCHHHDSEERPTFSDIVKILTERIESTTNAASVPVEPEPISDKEYVDSET